MQKLSTFLLRAKKVKANKSSLKALGLEGALLKKIGVSL